jgi:hypothetical protein
MIAWFASQTIQNPATKTRIDLKNIAKNWALLNALSRREKSC